VALAVGMQRALELWQAEAKQREARLSELRDSLESGLRQGWPDLVINAQTATRLPHTSNVSFPGLDRQALLMALDLAGVACSTGSACASGSSEPSPVLMAMGADEAIIGGSLRLSLGAQTTATQIDDAVDRILTCCRRLAGEISGS
jgi:cysteine desulfurase